MRLLLAASVSLAAGLGIGWWLGAAGHAERAATLRATALEAARRGDRLEARVAELEETARRERRRAPPPTAPVDPPRVPDTAGAANAAASDPAAPSPAGEPPGPGDPASRQRRVDTLRAAFDRWFEQGDGDAAVDALTELAALAPEGREAAMELALRINADVNGRGELGLSRQAFYVGLGDAAVRELMVWSLANETPAEFRVMAAYSLPWTQDPDRTVAQFVDALRSERDVRVQRALVANLSDMRRPEANDVLEQLFVDGNRDPVLRSQIATELALRDDPALLRVIEQAAVNDPEPRVREAAKAALVARDPPASGFLVTGTLPASQAEAAGLRAGDIVVSYGGRQTLGVEELRRAAAASSGDDSVALVVIRDGREVRLLCRPGRLGVFGRDVEAGER